MVAPLSGKNAGKASIGQVQTVKNTSLRHEIIHRDLT
jgi:hypothetical protein